jgi:ubiquinone/menaquinone biosynthesis C-methylase UbiE
MPPAFDAVAAAYDTSFTHTPLGHCLRERVYELVRTIGPGVSPAGRMLEINCGTGADAIWWAKKGWNVLATDVSTKMIDVAKSKLTAIALETPPEFKVGSFAELSELPETGFDLIFSNFGGLNCISAQEIEALSSILHQKLIPGGYLVVVVMGRFCLWETLYFLCKGKLRSAFRRWNRRSQLAALDGNTVVPTWYYSPGLLERRMQTAATWQKNALKPVGWWLPPSYLHPFFAKKPRLLRCLAFLERHCSPDFFASSADHYLLCLRRRPASR